ncbi:MAG: NAD(P)H-quinone dehydrogenase, partial [Actinobacteria bacterium]|nr:NAD(P)H-quinone dehydrogenase [Actinomycetota bacterium]
GYEAALVARQLGADVTLIHSTGLGGSAVLTDCVPSKALIATAGVITAAGSSASLGVRLNGQPPTAANFGVDLRAVNARINALAAAQSQDITASLVAQGVKLISGHAELRGPRIVSISTSDGVITEITAEIILIATGARPRQLPEALPDGERILDWEQLYGLTELPERLIVVGSGVTGAEFAGAYHGLGCDVVLVSSRDRVLPGEDPDAAQVIEDVFKRNGASVKEQSRAIAARRTASGVEVTLETGEIITGSHVLMAVGSLPNTDAIGLETAGVELDERGFIVTDRVSRTSVNGVYAAGDCTGVLMLASVAAMQGRIAMWHALGDAVAPIELHQVSSTVFTNPEIATVGVSQRDLDNGSFVGDVVLVHLAANARAKIEETHDGFVKLFCRTETRIIAGAVVVGPNASELIHSLTIAVEQRLTVDQIAATFTVYPSLSGSVAEAARRLRFAVG